MKIMHGPKEIAGQAYYSVKGLRAAGYKAELVLWDESPMKYPHDFCMNIDWKKKCMYPIYGIRMLWNFVKCALKYDTFHFHFGHSLLPKNLDLPILKILGKSIFFEFHGSDIRQKSIALKHNKNWQYYNLTNEELLRKRSEKLVKYARGFIIHDTELSLYIPPGIEIYYVPLRIEPRLLDYSYPNANNDGPVRIVHAPSHRGVKGSAFICSAIESLSKKYDIEFVLIEGKTQEEAFKEYLKADIIVDQMLLGTYGVFSIESMTMGKPVITYLIDEIKGDYPEELPIIAANIDTIEQKLEELIVDGKLRRKLGEKGRRYTFKYHDCKKIGKMLGMIYEGGIHPDDMKEAFSFVGNIDA